MLWTTITTIGNNVGQLVNLADGSLAAKYEYDPYGNLLESAGPMADANPFRFSTKYCDDELAAGPANDLYYYGYRYYLPRLGRWLNRDPIGEKDHQNLFVYIGNNPQGGIDPLGLTRIVFDFDAFINIRTGGWLDEPFPFSSWEYKGDFRGFGGGSSRLFTRVSFDSLDLNNLSMNNTTVTTDTGISERRLWYNTAVRQTMKAVPSEEHEILNYPDGCLSALHVKARAAYPFYPNLAPAIDYDFILLLWANPARNGIRAKVIADHNLFPDYEAILNDRLILKYETWFDTAGFWGLNLSTTSVGEGTVPAELPDRCCRRR